MASTDPPATPTADLTATGGNGSSPPASPSESGRRSRTTVEFRIHGIGNQLPWHALGEPRTIPAIARDDADGIPTDSADPVGNQPDRFIMSFSPPEHTRHLWLINWARTSRRTARFSWFLAIPMTMVNVAGYMRPEGKNAPGRRLVPFSVHVVAGLMSVAVVVWLAVLAETVLKHAGGWQPWVVLLRIVATAAVLGAWRALRGHRPIRRSLAAVVALWFVWLYTWPFDVAEVLPWQPSAWPLVYWFVVAVTGLGVTVGIWGRWKYGETKAPLGAVAIHSVITLLVTLVLLTRPVRWTAPDWLPSWATVPPPARAACHTAVRFVPGWVCGPRVDVVMSVVVLSLGTAVALAGLLLVAHARTPALGRTPNLAGAALLLVLGPLLLHTVASVSRVSLDWLLSYVDHLVRYVSPGTAWPNPIAFRLVTPTDVQGRFVYGIDIVVLLMVAFVVAMTFTGYLVGRAHLGATAPSEGASLPHRIVQGLPAILAPTLGSGLIAFVLLAVGLALVTDESPPLPAWAALLVALLVQAAAFFVALLYSGRLARARDVLSRIADVAGFWPVTYTHSQGPRTVPMSCAASSMRSTGRVRTGQWSSGTAKDQCSPHAWSVACTKRPRSSRPRSDSSRAGAR